ncbi:tyrosine-type recombinase/integrase [Snuella lapsa]|uniref:Core-binding (CB) domain-containing protein n=1 Tax=Snuella lapsa TaxID=870481 RepID=A0ABP6WTQ8_9FLAO
MENYEAYLLQNQYSQNTVTIHKRRIKRFKGWLKNYGITAQELSYSNLLKYAKYLQTEKKYERSSTNNELRAVKLYYDYLMAKGDMMENPAEDMAIRGKRIKVLNNLLSEEELEDLYYSYDIEHHDTFFKATKLRDKVVLGFMVFQGITEVELYHLQEEYLQLSKGKIDIPSTRRSNARTIKLQPCQMMDLMNYTSSTRQYLANRIKTTNNEQLIFGSTSQIHSIAHRIIKNLKQYNHKVTNGSQLRASLIVNWLSKHNLRQVQYLAGHRYISSTEKYVQDDLENLHEIVNNFHPIS